MAVDGICQLCDGGSIYDIESKECISGCDALYLVKSDGIEMCCSNGSTSELCKYIASSTPTTKVTPSFTDGLFEQQDCVLMRKSSIWGATRCLLTSNNNFLANKEVINIIGMKMEE